MSFDPAPATEAPLALGAIVLAAGRSTRMGTNKLLKRLRDGRCLIERVVDDIIASAADPVIVVIGHQAEAVRAALAGRAVVFAENQRYADGLSTSLHAGLRNLPAGLDGVFMCLGDMPAVGSALLVRMRTALGRDKGRGIVVPMRDGRRGNPVLWSSRFVPELLETTGDTGAKHLIGVYADQLVEIEAEDDGLFIDLDTPEAWERYEAR